MDFISKELLYQKSSQELQAFLYEACMERLETGIEQIEAKQYAEANQSLQKVNDLLERLGAGLNYEAGIIANQLDTLYNYMANQVIRGNLNKDVAALKEVATILGELASAWNEAMKMDNLDGQRERYRKTNAYEKNVFVTTND